MGKKTEKKKRLKNRIFLIIPFIILICITIIFFTHHKTSKVNSNLEANIEYIQSNISNSLKDNTLFNNDIPINITWDINEEGILTLPDNTTKKVNKNISLSKPGTYIIKVGKTAKQFTIVEEKIENYISFDESTNTVKFNNISNIISVEIDNNVFNIENNNIPTEYTFNSKGRYNIIIETITGKSLSKSYRISK